MEKNMYDQEWLIENKFPDLREEILKGEFRILEVRDDEGLRKVVRFPNLDVFAPDAVLIERIFYEVFIGHSPNDIIFMSYESRGIDITTKSKK